MPDDDVGRLVRIRGRVQGVWFRGWTVREAESRELRGWVRNRRDGSVEALFVGAADTVEAMIAACRVGPRSAEVTDVRTESVSADTVAALPAWFEQRETE